MSEISTLLENIDRVRFNPSAIQRLSYQNLEAVKNGELLVVDPSNPFSFLLESAAVYAASTMINDEATLRKQYAVMAVTDEELYMHMSDKDHVNRFATPVTAPFYLLLSKEEIYAKAVVSDVEGISKLIIPKNTEFTVADTKFTMQYPIEIRIMAHGGLLIVYDVDKPSPLQTMSTNIVDWDVVSIDKTEFVRLSTPVLQTEIKSYYGHLTTAAVFSKSYEMTNSYYYCRVYMANSSGGWDEILTTHTDQVFDPLTPTAVLKVTGSTLEIKIPQIYQTSGIIDRELRFDVYTTKGEVNLILNNYTPDSFSVNWRDLDGDSDSSKYISPLSTFSTLAVYSDSHVDGGSPALTFDELRERVMTNAFGSTNLPITNVQVGTLLADLGYDNVKNIDTITNRIFLATRRLPRPSDNSVISGAGCSINTVPFKAEDLLILDTVKDNGDRVTLLPNTLYTNNGGVVELVSDVVRESMFVNDIDLLANNVNQSRFLYSPFHYVFDSTKNSFESRPYYLENPAVDAKVFVTENDTVGVELGTSDYSIEKTDAGYILYVVTTSGVTVQEMNDDKIFAQLSFVPNSESSRAYINGELIGKNDDNERIYKFEINTDFDIDNENSIYLTNFYMFGLAAAPVASDLLGEFDLVFGVVNYAPPDMKASTIDNVVDNSLILVGDAIGVSRELYRIRFGWHLDTLWNNSRTVAGNMEYETYPEDVPAYWKENVYERDGETGNIKLILTSGGGIEYSIIHHKGDPILNEMESPVMLHYAGDLKLDLDGNPILIADRDLVRQVDMLMVEGNYYFATESVSAAYRKTIPQTLVSWITGDLRSVSANLLEQTEMFFYPQDTQGDINVIVREGETTVMHAEQTFTVTFYMTRSGYSNLELRNSLTDMAIETVSDILTRKIVAVNDMVYKLSAASGDDVIAVNVVGLGGDENYQAVTVVDDSARLSVKKKLVSLPDNTLTVEDDIEVLFIRHEV